MSEDHSIGGFFEHHRSTLERAGVRFEPPLTAEELARAEAAYELVFPHDLRAFLGFALPVSPGWPNWRRLDDAAIIEALRAPWEGIAFDIEQGVFWLPSWGPEPDAADEATAIARKHFEQAPKLVPVCGHRYMPVRPATAGNPVFSVHQTDIIHYGSDLWGYFQNEFSFYYGTPVHQLPEPIRRIDFWSSLIDANT